MANLPIAAIKPIMLSSFIFLPLYSLLFRLDINTVFLSSITAQPFNPLPFALNLASKGK
jgi:hypothetical protein